jgi:transcriptional regulator with XRE-family HTH domain
MTVPEPNSRPTPISVGRALRELGAHVTTWRKPQRLPTALVAERAGISRDTLRAIEHGTGTPGTENLFRVLRVLGVLQPVVAAADPYRTDVGRLHVDETLPNESATSAGDGASRPH